MKFQITYRANINFEETHENLIRLGYSAKRFPAGRPRKVSGVQQQDAGNLRFNLISGVKVNIFPKGKYNAIQVRWNSVEEMKKYEKELLDILVFSSDYVKTLTSFDFESKLMTINIKIPYDEKLLSEIDSAHSKYMKEMAKLRSLFR